ncbi:hypothetical protein RD792_008634 [Penstemon davidsonii]|uniref:Cytochrome P450 n=1 Tax=Penstemon davidsonii TaxID=160366 RepID=A0ABR0DAH3_9LAMI|nr:hypothetical protein RD792_008634 [Penstemon davidsonii]
MVSFEVFLAVLSFIALWAWRNSRAKVLNWPILGMFPKLMFNVGPKFREIFDVLGDGIFNSDSDSWKQQRKVTRALITHQLFNRHLVKMSVDKVEKGLIPVLEMVCKKNQVIDLQDLFQRYTFDTTCALVTGYDPGCLSVHLPDVPFARAMDEAEEAIFMRHVFPERIWKLLRCLELGPKGNIVKLGKFWTVSLLKKARSGMFLRLKKVTRLVYTHGAICEALRLYPPVPFQHKEPVKPDVLPTGHYVDPKMKIVFSLYAMGRVESIWGKDCLEFKPERWISERGTIKHEPSYKFLAFNAGPRTCLGREVAFTQMKAVAATLIHNYQIRVIEGHRIAPNCSIILYMKDGLKVKITKRMV